MSLLRELLGNKCIVIVSQPDCDAVIYLTDLIFLTSHVFYMTKKSRHKFKYVENEKRFEDKRKAEANKPDFLEGESPTLTQNFVESMFVYTNTCRNRILCFYK